MQGSCIIIVGGTGTGKTTLSRGYAKQTPPANRFIFDIQKQYGDLYPKPLLKFDAFIDKALTLKNYLILIEEATIFISNRGTNRKIIELLVNKRHANNIIILVFHSFSLIPKDIKLLSNYMVFLKTNDEEKDLYKFGDEKLVEKFRSLKKAAWLKGENGKLYSPHLIHASDGRV